MAEPSRAPAPQSEGQRWRLLQTADGSFTLAHPEHGESFHSLSGAWTQACERYVAGCRIAERLARRPGAELRVLDIGTGLGLNLAALLRAAEEAGAGVRVTSCERSREAIGRALELGARLPAPATESARLAERWLAPVRAALERALALSSEAGPGAFVPFGGRGELRLMLGDARLGLPALARAEPGELYDAVFLDPFSPRVEPASWEPAFLRRVAGSMAPGSWLSTYCAATAVRAGLRAAGLRVGAGARVGAKREGTLASPDGEPPPLDPRTQRRIERRAAALRDPAGAGAPPGREIPRAPGSFAAPVDLECR